MCSHFGSQKMIQAGKVVGEETGRSVDVNCAEMGAFGTIPYFWTLRVILWLHYLNRIMPFKFQLNRRE